MYAIFFKWRVIAGQEHEFQQAWAELTLLIRDQHGGLGSRLHSCGDGHFFAYAQWPSEQACKNQPAASARVLELRERMNQSAVLVDGPTFGTVVADLLVVGIQAQ